MTWTISFNIYVAHIPLVQITHSSSPKNKSLKVVPLNYVLCLLYFLNILEVSVFFFYLMYFSIFHPPCEQTILWLQLLIFFYFILVSSKWLLDRSVFTDGSYYGFETNVEQLYGAWLSVSTAVSICFTNSDCKLVLIQQQGKIFFIQADGNIPPLTDFFYHH